MRQRELLIWLRVLMIVKAAHGGHMWVDRGKRRASATDAGITS
jgi:hypothetical protein